MAKPKSPLLSLGATGTIGDTLTFQKRNRATMARSKPIPAYRYTLPQAYQRWLYQDYAYLWTQQSEATKREYAAAGSRFHLTGFQYWMKYNLANLPDIAGMWHLDKISNGSVIDFSKNANHGTVYGASLVDGIIDKALLFDGTDDYVALTTMPSDSIPHGNVPLSVELFVLLHQLGTRQFFIDFGTYGAAHRTFIFEISADNGWLFHFWDMGTTKSFTPTPNTTDWFHLCATYDLSFNRLYVNGHLVKTITYTQADIGQTLLRIGAYTPTSLNLKGIIDNAIIYNRVLDLTEIKRHSERRYPL